ncbi:transcription antitermination factor NusB [Tessaracoccus caeni]|uniref:transcription antitermination factor NusB n=1 Tax=Tessaracoccus caeni TaxID=3031239 RepID=UPI0023D980CF|nr:transcription antitermination factor NusB [Tessaracoccus caeni]MDF1489956.1 transcription antitermination factor NusB [Tessaracoccus caeni]
MTEKRRYTTTQTKARKAALDILYQAELRGASLSETISEQHSLAENEPRPLTKTILQGILEHGSDIDRRISESLDRSWTLERMNNIDRNLARIAVFEMDYTDTPDPAIISQAVLLAGEYSTDDSPAFLNGVLAKAMATKPNTN